MQTDTGQGLQQLLGKYCKVSERCPYLIFFSWFFSFSDTELRIMIIIIIVHISTSAPIARNTTYSLVLRGRSLYLSCTYLNGLAPYSMTCK